jgi:hypothetical protein
MGRYIGSDLAWLAVDAVGHMAVFTTAGVAPIPSTVLDHPDLVDPAEDLLLELPPVGDCGLLVRYPRPDDYINFARRGFFAYDWQDVHRSPHTRCYDMIARPEVPRSVEDIGAELGAVARLVRFGTLTFADSPAIRAEQLVPCESA